ncbi:GNAT family N-acetyltransferase [Tissierella sp.]|uniref:GNAT family N-acetyltransferase n=1 Tax=Tissierella sp. TaxID=41274 RepID=UPI002865A189|nr:GNAT family N-acetyltransferase [Tissierella sp.]MDR7857869.1 GNAT family N-acetyltransferase [Tissierella sp.]
MIENINFTPKALELIKHANDIARKNNFNAIHPVHLFLGSLRIDSEVNDELRTLVIVDEAFIESVLNSSIVDKSSSEYEQISCEGSSNINISLLTRDNLFEAKNKTELFEEHGQIFVNDGQILNAILNSEDKITQQCLSGLDKDLIISIIASPRDMVVNLNGELTINCTEDISIRKVTKNNKDAVSEFVLKNFYERWAKTIDYGLGLEDIPIYIAMKDDNIVGFAGYNISKQRKGYFGPLGVLKTYRDRKIGQALLNACLIDMKELGHETCIIGNGSSIEFYEKACGARIIPIINKKH